MMQVLAVAVAILAIVGGAVFTKGTVLMAVVATVLMIAVLIILGRRSVHVLGKDEQLKVEHFTEVVVRNGPGVVFLNPLGYRAVHIVKAESLATMDYIKIRDTVSGEERIERGPQLLFLGAYDKVSNRSCALTLSKTEQVVVEDVLSGVHKTVRGPCVFFPGPYDKHSAKTSAIALLEDEFIRVRDTATGQRWIQKGKDLVFLEPTWKLEGCVTKAWTLKVHEYVRLLDRVTGKVTAHRGEKTVFPGPNEELVDGDKMQAIDLKANEYVKLMDQTDGQIHVTAGPAQVFLGANEKVLDNGTKRAIQVDDEHAPLVRDIKTGQLRLVTEKQLFVPGPTEVIEEVRELYRLAEHEAMIIKDRDGIYHIHHGDPKKSSNNNETSRSFFLPPHSEVVKFWWSGGIRRAKRDLCIERFDCRPQFMWNEIECRTQDNVELVLETTLFWEVKDLATMIRNTGNLPGDIYNQIRSQFIKHVARVNLKSFMEQLHLISKTIFEEDKQFYEIRGVTIHKLDVTKYTCSEQRTSEVLQQIIEETTNRLNRLSQAESENEVKLFKMQGEIEHERLNSELLTIQYEHTKSEAAVAGAAEAERVAAFIRGLEKDVPTLQDRIVMWQVLRKKDALSVVSEGGASLYYTPNDVNLSIMNTADSAAPKSTSSM